MRRISLLTGIGRGLLWIAAIVLLGGCASQSPQKAPALAENPAMSPQIEKNKEMNPSRKRPVALPPLAELKPRVASEEKMAYEGKLFSLSARNTPMRDALLGLAQEAGLNLIIEKGVEPEEPVSAEMHDMPLKTAMEVLLSSYGYFYALEGNILRIKAVETRIFNFDYTLLSNTPTSSVGGSMMGEGGGGVSGSFDLSTTMDTDALDVWKQIEEVLTPGNTPGGGGAKIGGGAKGGGASATGGGGAGGGILSDLGQAQINKMAGNIIVTDRRENLNLVEEYLNRLQLALRRQVVIEAKIIEVILDENHQWGIDWAMLNSGIEGGGFFSFDAGFLPLENSVALTLSQNTGNSTLTTIIKALDSQGSSNVLSAPRINVLNNQSALISVGRSIPYLEFQPDTQINTNNVSTTTVMPKLVKAQAGISLGVTPQIDAEGMVTLHITPVITDSSKMQKLIYDGGKSIDVPILNSRTTDTIVRVRDGETVVLGGLITEEHSDESSKIPGLGDLPLLGHILFGGEGKKTKKSELVIMLTPTVVEL